MQQENKCWTISVLNVTHLYQLTHVKGVSENPVASLSTLLCGLEALTLQFDDEDITVGSGCCVCAVETGSKTKLIVTCR